MDANMEVDDLFGDNAAMNAAMDTAMSMPISASLKGLPQRVHEAQTSGCCQLIAWSKTGCVAYVAPDGKSVKLAFLSYDPQEQSWSLNDRAGLDKSITSDKKHPIVSLLWSPNLMDLAIADAAGRITVVNHSYMSMNSVAILRNAADDQENDLNQPVGMYWLNRERPSLWFLPTSKDNNWVYQLTKKVPYGPHHNLALATVTKSGNFRLLYQPTSGTWKTTSAMLRRMTSSGELVTHAAMGSMKDKSLVLAMQTYDRKLHVFRVKIEFNQEKGQPENVRFANISVEHIRGNVSAGIFKDPNSALLGEATLPSYSALQLSHLEIIPMSDIERTEMKAPIILAVYTASLNSMGLPNFAHGSPTIVARWQLSIAEHKLHPSFDEIGAKTTDNSLKKKIDLLRLDDVPMDQIVASVQLIDAGSIAFVLGDGSIQIYDPNTMINLHQQQELGKASTLSRAGFAFQGLGQDPAGLHVALSPNNCVAAVLDNDGKIHCRDMRLWQTSQNEGQQQLGLETTMNVLSLSFARACLVANTTDDIVKLVMEQFPDHQTLFLETVYQALFTDADFTSGLDQLAKKSFIPKVLSLQAALGYQKRRNVSSALCWTTLNIRHVSLHLLLILTYLKQTGGVEYRDPDVLSAVLHNINYAQALFAYLLNNLFEIAVPTFASPPTSPDSLQAQHTELTSLILLSSWSRFFLRHLSRALRGLTLVPQSGSAVNPKALPAFTRIAREIDPDYTSAGSTPETGEPTSPIKMEAVERLIVGVEKFVMNAYENAGLTTDAQKAAVEREMLAHANVPEVLSGVIPKVVKEILPITRTEVNHLDVWESDYTWLGLWHRKGGLVDIHKKRAIKQQGYNPSRQSNMSNNTGSTYLVSVKSTTPGKPLRACVRCGEVSEDLVPGRGLPIYFRQQIGRCVCEGNFYVTGRGSKWSSVEEVIE